MRPSLIILIFLFTVSCGHSQKLGTSKEEARKIEMQNAIENKRWVLQELHGAAIPKGERDIYITFKNASAFDGNGGCNNFSGHYKIDVKTISLGDLISTEMACPGLEIENKFFDVLREAKGYKVVHDHLLLMNDTEEIASFDAVYLK